MQSRYRDAVILAGICAVAVAVAAYKVSTASAFSQTLIATQKKRLGMQC